MPEVDLKELKREESKRAAANIRRKLDLENTRYFGYYQGETRYSGYYEGEHQVFWVLSRRIPGIQHLGTT